ncbi:MAG: L,D-transpeptidase [Acidobacteriota bacterium]|nr:L,D-transpeptidase [Acidobacteriota bacterium]
MAELKDEVQRQEARLGPFRDFRTAEGKASALLAEGGRLLGELHASRDGKRRAVRDDMTALRMRLERLHAITGYFNDNEAVRTALAQADIKLGQAALLSEAGELDESGRRLRETEGFLEEAQAVIGRRLERYLEPEMLRKWRTMADETIAVSRRTGGTALIVNKIERTLIVIRKGEATATYGIGLGKSGLSDKLYEGDGATPEGKYRIIRKFPASAFYKALLIDYPNGDDLRNLAEAKNRGAVPARVGAGGEIEIHGGGKDNLTRGCVGLENADMDKVYKAAELGTPVTIVGALGVEGTILVDIKAFGK